MAKSAFVPVMNFLRAARLVSTIPMSSLSGFLKHPDSDSLILLDCI